MDNKDFKQVFYAPEIEIMRDYDPATTPIASPGQDDGESDII